MLLGSHWYFCFGLQVMSPLGFKARVDSLIWTWQRHSCYTFPEIHLWFYLSLWAPGVLRSNSSKNFAPQFICFRVATYHNFLIFHRYHFISSASFCIVILEIYFCTTYLTTELWSGNFHRYPLISIFVRFFKMFIPNHRISFLHFSTLVIQTNY